MDFHPAFGYYWATMTRQQAVLAMGVIAVSFAAVLIRLADAPPLVIAAGRMAIASLVVVPAAWWRSSGELRALTRRELLLAVLSGAFLALHFGLWIASLSYTSVASSVVLVTASPIFVAIASHFFFGERLGRQVAIGIVVCLAGAVVIGYGSWRVGPGSLLGGGLALSGALSVAGYVLIGRRLRQRIGVLSYASLTYGTAAVLLVVAAVAFGHSFSGYSGTTYLMLVLLAVVPQLLGHTSLNWSLRFVSATLVTVAVLGEPVMATALAWFILDEAPTLSEVIGGLLIIGGIFVAFRRSGIQLEQR